MTVPATAPSMISALASQIASAAAWTTAGASAASIFYPRVSEGDATDPCCILWQESREVDFPFLGVPLESGTLVAEISSATLGVDDIESLAEDLAEDVLTSTGIPYLRVSGITPADEADHAEEVGTGALRGVQITFAYGLEATT